MENVAIYKKALWIEEKKLRFFSPLDTAHVSHSILNYQNNYRTDSDFIEVEAITIDKLLHDFNIKKIDLIKLDIEGAEIEVIQDMLDKNISPAQILVEYDELAVPSKKSKLRIQACHNALVAKGYRLINFDKPSNFLYTNLS
jgi:FkbM family methyltransferase